MGTQEEKDRWNRVRYDRSSSKGHYESYFFRANHPDEPRAFWVRYTIFSPKHHPERAIGELWSIFFDGERNSVVAGKSEHPIHECSFSDEAMDIRIAGATASRGRVRGSTRVPHRLEWDLAIDPNESAPLLTLPEGLYDTPLPRAKALVTSPFARFTGVFVVDGETVEVDHWVGSENHNWGEKHADEYVWGQVAEFEEVSGLPADSEVFLEAFTGRVKLGPLYTPTFSMLTLRINGVDHKFNTLRQALKAKASYSWTEWNLVSDTGRERVEMRIDADKANFVGLNYYNPPGGSHTVLNCKIARCALTYSRNDGEPAVLRTSSKAAIEILTDLDTHGIPIVA